MFVAYHLLLVATVFLVSAAADAALSQLSGTEVKSNQVSKAETTSPCPNLFQYESLNPNEPDRWYGTLTILSEHELSGVWIRLIFDKPPIDVGLAGNWSGEVVSRGTKDYLVKNSEKIVTPNEPQKLRFYIKYNPQETAPRLHSFRLNARTVCSSYGDTTPDSDDGSKEGEILGCATVSKPPLPHKQASPEGEFPWHGSLYQTKSNGLDYMCGASLISRHYLVTAAHCVTKTKTSEPSSPDSLVVYLGKFYRKSWAIPEIQSRQVEQIITHPEYDPETFSNDIAIIKMTSPIVPTNYVYPVCLWDDEVQQLPDATNKAGNVIGWGFDKEGTTTEQLTLVNMSIEPQETCKKALGPDSKFTSTTNFCAGFNKDASFCNGDSGSGMVIPKATTGKGGSIWQLRGLVSVGVAQQNHNKCDASNYMLFTDVAKFLPWILSTIN